MINPDKAILVGELTKPHGLKGFIKLRSFTQNPKDIFEFDLYNSDFSKKYSIIFKKPGKQNIFIVEIDGVNDKDEVSKYRDTKLYIKRSQLPLTEVGEFYHEDLKGLKVLL